MTSAFKSRWFSSYSPGGSVYYITILRKSYNVLVFYLVFHLICLFAFGLSGEWFPAAVWFVLTCAAKYALERIHIRWSLLFYSILVLVWILYTIHTFGWNCGSINFLFPLIVLSAFSLYDSLRQKIIFIIMLFVVRMLLYQYSVTCPAVYNISYTHSFLFRVLNTAAIFINSGVICIILSNNIQKAEKQLMHSVELLKHQADTDPLTGLSNRRCMRVYMEHQIQSFPEHIFCIAMGDIDFFKKVNDTYGHACGDQVLVNLAELFRKKTLNKGHVCRWGGEEFLFFLPNMNLDQAAELIHDINLAVSNLPIVYDGQTHFVTMTFGVEEYDYQGNLDALIKQADDKLYYGKLHGRNQEVI